MMKKLIRHERRHMATTFDFRISSPASSAGLADRILSAAHDRVSQVECQLSEFLPESPVHTLNHSPSGTRVVFTSAGIDLLKKSDEVFALTDGTFNVLAKSKDPNAAIEWDESSREVWKKTDGTWLGFGAIGKGYAIDCAREEIEMAGFENYLLSGGGSSIALSGMESEGQPWRWGWSWKKDAQGDGLGISFAHWSGKKVSLGVSGTHEQGEHILGANTRLKSALIAGPSAATADALSTALFASGWERIKSGLSRLALAPAAAWIDENETPHWNGVFQTLWRTALSLFLITLPLLWANSGYCDESVDLSADLGAKAFLPYVFDRNRAWIILPIFIFALVLLHLKKTKPKRNDKRSLKSL